MDKEAIKARENKIAEIAVGFCKEHIDEVYATLSEKLVRKLGCKRWSTDGRRIHRVLTRAEPAIGYTPRIHCRGV